MDQTNSESPQPEQTQDERDEDEARHDYKVLDSFLAQLMEHFDTVQIVATKHCTERDASIKRQRGDGNWYARYGSVKEWINDQERPAGASTGE